MSAALPVTSHPHRDTNNSRMLILIYLSSKFYSKNCKAIKERTNTYVTSQTEFKTILKLIMNIRIIFNT